MTEEKHYTWEEKIDSLMKLAKATGRYINSEETDLLSPSTRSDYYHDAQRKFREAYGEFCEWRHAEPYVVDEIKVLIQSGQPVNTLSGTCTGYIDDITGIQMLIGAGDTPEHPAIQVTFPKDRTLSLEQMNGAIHRLRDKAGMSPTVLPDLIQ